jgi:Protein of unknown function (DUF3455)
MRRLFLLALTLATASLAIAVPSLAARRDQLPEALRVPEGHRLVLRALGKGVQVYDCVDGAWSFREPAAAILRGDRTIALHYAGPTWQSIKDGSKVVGTVMARVDAEHPERDIPLLLLRARSTGPGLFSGVKFIQRLETEGGVAPAGSCRSGASIGVPYTATYTFWARA